jgi:hypothetical protein
MKILLTLFLLISLTGIGQTMIPFVDFNQFFRTFEKGTFRQIEFQRIENFKAGDEVVAYYDNRGNLIIYDAIKKVDVANINAEYVVSDHLVTWKIGETLNLWDAGKMQTLTYRCSNYATKDSIVVFQDNRFNTINAYFEGTIYPITQMSGELTWPENIGENIFAYRDNGDFYRIFWNGEIYDLDVWVGNMEFSCGTDILSFNDPINRSFAVFDKGEFVDVEQQFVVKHQAGRGFVVYEDRNGNLIKYQDGERTTLSNFGASFWEVKDDIIIWYENNFLYSQVGDKKIQVCNFLPTDYKLKNNVLAYRNVMKGVDVVIDGKVINMTNQIDAKYDIYGNSIIVELFNSTFKVYWKGREYNL